jgi:hypothetical protein
MTVPLGRCRACHQLVRWAITAAHGKPIPLDPDPSPAGTVLVTRNEWGADIARIWHPIDRECPPDVLYVVHFVTCEAKGKSGKEVEQRALARTLAKAREGL